MIKPHYFEKIQVRAVQRWNQHDQDPENKSVWRNLFNQVKNPRRVVSELLQNADDAGATEASADIQNGEFVLTHNGKDFTEDNFSSLCQFGYSNKRSLHTIGFRGIGFKSTFSLGDQVCLITPTLSVAFNHNRFTEPVWCDLAGQPSYTSVRVAIKDEYREKHLKKNLSEWLRNPASLLFFRNIRSLRIGDNEVQWESQGNGPIQDSEWMSTSSSSEKKHLLIRSPVKDFPPEALEEITQERTVLTDEGSVFPPCQVEIVLGLTGRLFVILPTGVTTDLPFACNAPFLQDPVRDKIKDPDTSPTNRWLLHRVGKLAAKALLAWVRNNDLNYYDRVQAYNLLSDVDREHDSLETQCATLIEQAIDDTIGKSKFLLTEAGKLVARGKCQAALPPLLEVWSHKHVAKFFADKGQKILSQHVSDNNRQKLEHWGCINIIDKAKVLQVLESEHLPRPESWRQLMMLWDYISYDVNIHYDRHTDVKVVPVQGRNVLYAADEVVRLSDEKLLQSEDDWNFLAEHLLALHQKWPRFLAKQRRRASDWNDVSLGQKAENANALLERFELGQANDTSEVIQKAADNFFAQDDCEIPDCIRLAQLAATLGVAVTESFQFVTRDEHLRSAKDCIVADIHNDLDVFVDGDWYEQHVLHDGYSELLSCTRDEWHLWVPSWRSRLATFVPLVPICNRIENRPQLIEALKVKGFNQEPHYKYKTHKFIVKDWDFGDEHWQRWNSLASDNSSFWTRLLTRVLDQPPSFWEKALSAIIHQESYHGDKTCPVTSEKLLSSWLVKFRSIHCLPDTRGNFCQPAELLLRTQHTESLLDVDRFIRADLDTEATRSLLDTLGVRDTPTGPDQLLGRLRALALADNPPVYEVEKWYHRLDQLVNKCSTEELESIKNTFAEEKIILTESSGWGHAGEVFLSANEEDVPTVALIHPSVQKLALWHRVGVAGRPTADLTIDWLASLKSGQSLSPDEARRVRSLLPRYPARIWNECGHWLNLESEWMPTKDLNYSLTMRSLVKWTHLFKPIKQKTAHLRQLSIEICNQHPFSSLSSLAQSIENRFENPVYGLPAPQKMPWLHAVGSGLRRVTLDSKGETQRVRELADRLLGTDWQPTSGLQTVPYIDGTPVGTPLQIDALWRDSLLYVKDRSPAKLAKPVALEIGNAFDTQEVTDAILYCFNRSPKDVLEYLEENFTLVPEEQVSPIRTTSKQAEKSEVRDKPEVNNEVTSTSQTNSDATHPTDNGARDTAARQITNEKGGDTELHSRNGDNNSEKDGKEEKSTTASRKQVKPAKPSLMERFAKANGYTPAGSDLFFHNDDSKIKKVSEDDSFPWKRISATGELLQCYWAKDHCIEHNPLQINKEVWDLCVNSPKTYSLLLVAPDEKTPVEYSGERLCALRDNGQITLFSASYRLVYKPNQAKDNPDE